MLKRLVQYGRAQEKNRLESHEVGWLLRGAADTWPRSGWAGPDVVQRLRERCELTPGIRLLSRPGLGMMDAACRESTPTIASP